MIINIKGFASNANLTSNSKDVVAKVGELSAWSQTFATDRGIYYRDDIDAILLTTFTTVRDGNYIPLSVNLRNHILLITKWLYDKALNQGTEIYAHELLPELTERYQNVAENWACGQIVQGTNCWMPEWVSWKMKHVTDEINIRIWFSDRSFQNTYDDYTIKVVPPTTSVDHFFRNAAGVQAIVDAATPVVRMEKLQAAKGDDPETFVRTEMFEWNDPNTPGNKIKTYWDILIYGEAGNNVDSIKDAIINYIMSRTTKTREEWMNIFPDIFKRTEFVLMPNWDLYAIPNRITEAGIYSPVLQYNTLFSRITPFCAQYPNAHISTNMQVMSHPYKSLMISVCGGNENRDNKFKITDIFPDYIAQSSTSQDFNRQTVRTRTWAEKISAMLLIAEEMTQYSDIPRGYTRLIRDGKLFLVWNYENIHYLVAAKSNFD